MRAIVRAIRRRIAFKLTLTLVGFVGVSMVAAGFFLNRALENSPASRSSSLASVARGRGGGGGCAQRPPRGGQAFACAWRARRRARHPIAADGRVVGESTGGTRPGAPRHHRDRTGPDGDENRLGRDLRGAPRSTRRIYVAWRCGTPA